MANWVVFLKDGRNIFLKDVDYNAGGPHWISFTSDKGMASFPTDAIFGVSQVQNVDGIGSSYDATKSA